MTGRGVMRWIGGGAAAGLLLLASCGGDASREESGDHSASGDDSGAPNAERGAPSEEAQDAAGGEAEEASLAVDPVALAQSREIIRTGTMTVTVDDSEEAAGQVRRIATGAGGFVADEQVQARSSTASLTIRIPADGFDAVRDQVAEVGDVAEQNVEAQDVTAEMVDVESRIASLQASVARLQTLLGGAGDVGQLAIVEGELARREVELEALLGQQRVLEDQVALATLTVQLTEEEDPAPDEDAPGFGDGFRRGWVAAIDGGRALLAAVGFLLPFAVPAALVAAVVTWWMRRHRKVLPETAKVEP